MEVNREIRWIAVEPWVPIWEVDGPQSWIYSSLARFYSIETSPDAAEQIAALVRADLVPWVKSWPEVYLEMLRVSLEFSITHDQTGLRELEAWTSLSAAENVVDAVWLPLFVGVFGSRPRSLKLEDYKVLPASEAHARLQDLRLSSPTWDWLIELEAEAAKSRAEQLVDLFLFERPDDRFLPAEEKETRFGRAMLAEGRMALDAAGAWHLEHPTALWPIPDGLPIPPTHGAGRLRNRGEVFCSRQRAPEWESRRQRPVDFEELEGRLRQAGIALGLSATKPIEELIPEALEQHSATNFACEPWKSWAIVAQALVDARIGDYFLRL